MAGEIVKTVGIAIAIHPWSRTSHVVTWLTPDRGCVSTVVKGAVRPKSAFLGQYDLFYVCDLLYYARASGGLHPLRESVPVKLRDNLRGRWRETAIAGYAASLLRDLAPPGTEASAWYSAFDDFLESLSSDGAADSRRSPKDVCLGHLIRLEMRLLRLGGLAPILSPLPPLRTSEAGERWFPFAIDGGRFGEGARTVRLSPDTVAALLRPDAGSTSLKSKEDAVRFLGVFLSFHLDTPPDVRRSLVHLLSL